MGRDVSRESSLALREGSREFVDVGAVSSKGKPKLSVEIRDAIILLVRREQTSLFNEIQEKLRLLTDDVAYMQTQIKDVFTIIPRHAGGQVIDMEVPDALRTMLDKADFAQKTLAVHEARLQESEGFLQELACIQREFATKYHLQPPLDSGLSREATTDSTRERRLCKMESELKARLEKHISKGQDNATDVRLRKIESELSELQGLSRDHTLSSGPYMPEAISLGQAKNSTAYNPLCSEPRRVQPVTRQQEVAGDHGCEMESDIATQCDIEDGSSAVKYPQHVHGLVNDAPISHAAWLTEYIPDEHKLADIDASPCPVIVKPDKLDTHNGSHNGAVDTSHIDLEERPYPLQSRENRHEDDHMHKPEEVPHEQKSAGVPPNTKKSGSSNGFFSRWMAPRRAKKSKGQAEVGEP